MICGKFTGFDSREVVPSINSIYMNLANCLQPGCFGRLHVGRFEGAPRGGDLQYRPREVKTLMRLLDGRNVATRQAVHGSAPCARTEVLALFAVGDVYVSLCKKKCLRSI